MVYCKSWLYWYLGTLNKIKFLSCTENPTRIAIRFFFTFTDYFSYHLHSGAFSVFVLWDEFVPGYILRTNAMYCNLYFNWLTCRNKWFYWFISSFKHMFCSVIFGRLLFLCMCWHQLNLSIEVRGVILRKILFSKYDKMW
jgi:hypothetical protein